MSRNFFEVPQLKKVVKHCKRLKMFPCLRPPIATTSISVKSSCFALNHTFSNVPIIVFSHRIEHYNNFDQNEFEIS